MCLCLDTVANKTFGGLKDEIQNRSGIRSWKFYLHDGNDVEFGDFVVGNIYTVIITCQWWAEPIPLSTP